MREIDFLTCRKPLKYSQRQKMVFYKQLALILGSGLSLLQGLELMEKRADKNLTNVCAELRISLIKGHSLAEAMQEQGRFFSQLAVALTIVGEESGHLSEVLRELSDYYGKQEELKAVIIKASLYPVFLLSFSTIILCFFIVFVLPILGNAYLALQVQPTGILSMLLMLQDMEAVNVELLFFIISAIIVIAVYKIKSIKEFVLSIPPICNVYHMLLELRFCKLLALMLSSGIDITRAVDLCSAALGDKNSRLRVQLFKRYLQRGMDIGKAAGGCRMFFSPMTIELITVGAATGYLPEMLEEAAKLCERDLYAKLDKLRELLAPCLLLIASLVIGTVVCSVIEPLFGLVGQM